MKIFKFGGASVKDGAAVKNVSHILSLFGGEKRTVIISAMGKTTNEMEKIVDALWKNDKKTFTELVDDRLQFHLAILNELFTEKHFAIYTEVENLLGDASKAKEKLGWQPKITFEQMVKEMIEEDLKLEIKNNSK
jgi:aspartate kinase